MPICVNYYGEENRRGRIKGEEVGKGGYDGGRGRSVATLKAVIGQK